MNAAQMKYLFTQLDEIQRSLNVKIADTYPDCPTAEDKYTLIMDRKVSLKPVENVSKYTYLFDAYDFSDTQHKCNTETRRKKYDALAAKIQDMKNSVVFDGELNSGS